MDKNMDKILKTDEQDKPVKSPSVCKATYLWCSELDRSKR